TAKANVETARTNLNNVASGITPPTSSFAVAPGSCAQQLDNLAFGLNVSGTAVQAAGVAAEIGGAFDPTGIAEAATIAIQVVGLGLQIGNTVVEGIQKDMP